MWVDGVSLPLAAHPSHTRTVARLHGISDGLDGAIQTLRHMRSLARQAIREPAQQVRETALQIVGDAGWVGQIRCLQDWIQQNIRYQPDPIDSDGGVELVQTPQKTLEYACGDCDDQSVLLASFLSALGHPARFVAIGLRGDPLSHVLVQTKVANTGNDAQDWTTAETIVAKPLGWFPANVTSRYILKV